MSNGVGVVCIMYIKTKIKQTKLDFLLRHENLATRKQTLCTVFMLATCDPMPVVYAYSFARGELPWGLCMWFKVAIALAV